MNNYKDNLLVRLRNQTISLSPKLKTVADYISIHAETVQFQTITDLARCTSTSEATVVRMCRDFGFKGYSDFRMALAKDLSSTAKTVPMSENQNIYDQAALQAIGAIEDTRTLLNLDVIEQVVSLIEKSQYINFVGVTLMYITLFNTLASRHISQNKNPTRRQTCSDPWREVAFYIAAFSFVMLQ